MRLFIISIFSIFLLGFTGESPQKITWGTLAEFDHEIRYNEENELYFRFPLFGEKVKSLQDKEVYITGYMLPIDVEAEYYVLSAYPFANCFFCGAAGAESVIELGLKEGHRRFKTDERLTIKGIFKLNSTDIYQLNYLMEEAEVYEIEEEE